MSVNVILNNGVKIPIIGFGLWALYSNECIQCVKDAISVGYRHFDTAQVYRNEREVGEGIRQSKFPRDQLPIYYNYFFNIILFYFIIIIYLRDLLLYLLLQKQEQMDIQQQKGE